MKVKVKIIVISILIISSQLFTGCVTHFHSPKLESIEGIKLNTLNFKQLDLAFSARISNPNRYKIKIKTIDAGVYIKDQRIGSIQSDSLMVLSKNSNSVIRTSLQSTPGKLLMNIPSLLEFVMQGKELEVRIEGDMRIKARGIGR